MRRLRMKNRPYTSTTEFALTDFEISRFLFSLLCFHFPHIQMEDSWEACSLMKGKCGRWKFGRRFPLLLALWQEAFFLWDGNISITLWMRFQVKCDRSERFLFIINILISLIATLKSEITSNINMVNIYIHLTYAISFAHGLHLYTKNFICTCLSGMQCL